MDSRRSFEVACQAIDTIIPHVRSVCRAKGGERALREMSLSIVATFVDASKDMAAHRFKVRTEEWALAMGFLGIYYLVGPRYLNTITQVSP